MTELFLIEVKNESDMQKIVQKYTSTPIFGYVQGRLLDLDVESEYLNVRWSPGGFYKPGAFRNECENIIDNAVRTHLLGIKK